MPGRSWIQIDLRLSQPYQDLLTGQLAALGLSGFVQEDALLRGFLPAKAWTNAMKTRLKAQINSFRAEFPNTLAGYRTSRVREVNWNARWERSVGIVEATPHIVVKPSWRPLRKRDRGKIVLRIDPQMAFGTGHHESTRLCLHLMERYVRPKTRVLDAGTGTGILAIAAIRLGARKAVGIDSDVWSVRNARENAQRNRVRDRVSVRHGDLRRLPGTPFDLVVANIDLPTILSSLRTLKSRLAPGGVLILSGLLNSDLERLLDQPAIRRLQPIELVSENEWAAVAFTPIHANWRN